MKTIAVLMLCASALCAQAVELTDGEARALIAYGRLWDRPDQFYRSALPHSKLAHVASGREVRFLTDHARIALEACRAKLLMKPFDVEDAHALYRLGRLHAILEADSMTVNGARIAQQEFGGPNVNLVLLLGDDIVQPISATGARATVEDGVAITQVRPIARNIYSVNTLGLASGLLTRAFAFDLPSIPDKANFILIRGDDGKKLRFTANLAMAPELETETRAMLRYAADSTVKPGKPVSLAFSLLTQKGKDPDTIFLVEADSIWRTPTVVGQHAELVSQITTPAVFRYRRGEDAGVYQLELSTAGLSAGRYDLRVRIGKATRSLPFGIK